MSKNRMEKKKKASMDDVMLLLILTRYYPDDVSINYHPNQNKLA